MLDGVEITSEEKVKAENIHGYDMSDREIIFKSLLPEEKFVDRRISKIDDVMPESDSDDVQELESHMNGTNGASVIQTISTGGNGNMAKQYVGELISRVDFNI